jgi:hypothetical protein
LKKGRYVIIIDSRLVWEDGSGDRVSFEVSTDLAAKPARRRHTRDQRSWNASGLRGVYPNGRYGYRACITIGRKTVYLGNFLKAEDAAAAYQFVAEWYRAERKRVRAEQKRAKAAAKEEVADAALEPGCSANTMTAER